MVIRAPLDSPVPAVKVPWPLPVGVGQILWMPAAERQELSHRHGKPRHADAPNRLGGMRSGARRRDPGPPVPLNGEIRSGAEVPSANAQGIGGAMGRHRGHRLVWNRVQLYGRPATTSALPGAPAPPPGRNRLPPEKRYALHIGMWRKGLLGPGMRMPAPGMEPRPEGNRNRPNPPLAWRRRASDARKTFSYDPIKEREHNGKNI